MPTTQTLIRVFVASPSDVGDERSALKRVIDEINQTVGDIDSVRLDLVNWETHARPGFGEDAQDVINRQIGDNYDVFLGIMWGRFGSPTRRAESGTEEEFERALTRWKAAPDSVEIMFYFKDAAIARKAIEPEQIKSVDAFKRRIGVRGLYEEFTSTPDFETKARVHLTKSIQEWKQKAARDSGTLGSPATPSTSAPAGVLSDVTTAEEKEEEPPVGHSNSVDVGASVGADGRFPTTGDHVAMTTAVAAAVFAAMVIGMDVDGVEPPVAGDQGERVQRDEGHRGGRIPTPFAAPLDSGTGTAAGGPPRAVDGRDPHDLDGGVGDRPGEVVEVRVPPDDFGSTARTSGTSEPDRREFRNSWGMEFVRMSPGTFTMGSPEAQPDRRPDETQHRVTISEAFYLAKYEVTRGQWEAVMGRDPLSYKADDCSECPVGNVDWDEIQEFILRLNLGQSGPYRLPTEAEWEYAARAGTQTAYGFGDEPIALGAYGWYDLNSRGLMNPVGQKRPNEWGLYDIHGSVWELVSDWHGPYPQDPVTDPKGPSTGTQRVRRGGSHSDNASFCRTAYRGAFGPFACENCGFRLARAMSFENSVGMEFVQIEPGTFPMGSPPDEADREATRGGHYGYEALHPVTLSEPFFLGRYEVTQAQWEAVMQGNPSTYVACGGDCPVETVFWEDVQDFIRRLNEREGTDAYRLPTEAEWEYAARAGTETAYHFGDDVSLLCQYANFGDLTYFGEHPYYCADGVGGSTAPVGSYQPNDWGLHDMHGNVEEWVADRYGPYPPILIVDPQGPGAGEFRLRRGGSWADHASSCRAASRHYVRGQTGSTVGFRLAKTIR